ncbi:porin family protein [Massilia sp. METH4]|uniref:porin family protein n=1 Tax=Massilia sp. METH4 TaxID=3123041 RepID=UPI0030D477D2
MKHKTLVALLPLLAVFAASSALAQSYAGISLGKRGTQQWREASGTVLEPTDKAVPVTVYGGWHLNDTWALEAGYARLSDADYATAGGKTSARSGALYAAGKATFPINDKLAWYLKGGVARNYLVLKTPGGREEKEHNFRPMGTVGMEYRVTPRVAAVAELASYGKIETPKARMRHNVLQLGVRFDF